MHILGKGPNDPDVKKTSVFQLPGVRISCSATFELPHFCQLCEPLENVLVALNTGVGDVNVKAKVPRVGLKEKLTPG